MADPKTTAYAVEMIRVQRLSQYCRDAEPGIACVEASCTCQDKVRAALVLRPDIDPAERAWHQGAIARRSEIKRDANPYPVRESREWNAWAGSWAAEDHNIRTIDIPEIEYNKVSTITDPRDWTHMDEAPRDGTLIEVFVPQKHGLPGFISDCSWHPDAGFCVDELREPTAWRPKH